MLGQPNSGNFLAIIKLLAGYDPVLKDLISRPEGSVNPERTHLHFAQRVKRDIVADINKARFFSVIMDTTQDLAKRDQLSQVYRYVTIVRDAMDKAVDKNYGVFFGVCGDSGYICLRISK